IVTHLSLLGASCGSLVKFPIMWAQGSAVKTQYCLSSVGISLRWMAWRNQADRVQWVVSSIDFLSVLLTDFLTIERAIWEPKLDILLLRPRILTLWHISSSRLWDCNKRGSRTQT